ncbi:helix-turn-helix domain-containing protein [Saccharomonospora sp. NPDC006951]
MHRRRRRPAETLAFPQETELAVTEVCFAVGFASLGSFSTQFRRFVGESPVRYRQRFADARPIPVPGCYVRMWSRPSE